MTGTRHLPVLLEMASPDAAWSTCLRRSLESLVSTMRVNQSDQTYAQQHEGTRLRDRLTQRSVQEPGAYGQGRGDVLSRT